MGKRNRAGKDMENFYKSNPEKFRAISDRAVISPILSYAVAKIEQKISIKLVCSKIISTNIP
jgi:hypothetical protein